MKVKVLAGRLAFAVLLAAVAAAALLVAAQLVFAMEGWA